MGMDLYNSLLAAKLADGGDFSPTTAQLAAMNSGITADRLSTDETNIFSKISLRDILGYGTVIPAGTEEAPQDLNNYTSMGVFTIENSATAGTISNVPVVFPGRIFVLAGFVAGTNIQIYLTGENLYIRRKSATNVWTAWVSMV